MASTATPSTLTLSSIFSQELNPNSLIFKSKPLLFTSHKSFSLHTLSLQYKERKNGPLVVAAMAAEAEVEEDVEQEGEEGGEGAVAVLIPPSKPKKGKAALPLKRDRVC